MSEPLDPSDCCRWPEPDPLDESDHRDRHILLTQRRIVRHGQGHWHTWATSGKWCDADCTEMSLRHWERVFGPLTFAPKPTAEATEPEPTHDHGDAPDPARPKLNLQTESWTAIYTGEEVISSGGFSAWLEAHDREVVSRTLLETADEHLAKAEGFRNLIPSYFRGPGVNGAHALNNQIADGFDLSAHWLKYKAERINNV